MQSMTESSARLAAEKEQRFRVLIQDNETWSTVRDNRRREQSPLDP